MSDLFVEEIHRIREENARRHMFDAQAMARSFIRRQQKSGHAIVELRKSNTDKKKRGQPAFRVAS